MKILKQIFIILFFYVLGEIISVLMNKIIFIPGAIIGMVLLLLALIFKIIKIEQVDSVATFLTTNMAFFFIPAAVSVMEYFQILQTVIGKIILICIISVLLTFFIVSITIKIIIYKKDEEQ